MSNDESVRIPVDASRDMQASIQDIKDALRELRRNQAILSARLEESIQTSEDGDDAIREEIRPGNFNEVKVDTTFLAPVSAETISAETITVEDSANSLSQYLLADGSRDLSGSMVPDATNTVSLGDETDYWRRLVSNEYRGINMWSSGFSSGQHNAGTSGSWVELTNFTWTIPGGTMTEPGDLFVLDGTFWGLSEASSVLRRGRLTIGGVTASAYLFNFTSAKGSQILPGRWCVRYRTDSVTSLTGMVITGSSVTSQAGTIELSNTGYTSLDWTSDQEITIDVYSDTATNNIGLTEACWTFFPSFNGRTI